jgi:hypothetical protein
MADEISINQWLKSMAEAGFTGKFTASNADMTIKGELVQVDDKVKVKVFAHEALAAKT